uniref:Uncharacterized protein n=1 Tax=Solanum tuberosum TaxID=4113 RepID=M1A826_SOLTU
MDSCLLISCILKMSHGGSIFPSSSQPPFYLNVGRATQGWNLNFQALKRIENKLLYMLYTPVGKYNIQVRSAEIQVEKAKIRSSNKITGPRVRELAIYMVYTSNIHLVYIMAK